MKILGYVIGGLIIVGIYFYIRTSKGGEKIKSIFARGGSSTKQKH